MNRERVEEYGALMGMSVTEIGEFVRTAKPGGLLLSTWYSYFRAKDTSRPLWENVVMYCRRMTISNDWMAGLDVPMWSEPVWNELRDKAHAALQSNPPQGTDVSVRLAHIIRTIHESDPEQYPSIFMAGLLKLDSDQRAALESIFEGKPASIPVEVIQPLCQVFKLNTQWVLVGVGEMRA